MDERAFVEELAEATLGETFNFYREGPGAAFRRARLVEYLAARAAARIVLVGEAAGYRGARVSGLPFTSERQISGSGLAEATATIVQRVLRALRVEEDVLLWNVVPTHPHEPGRPDSNRRPTRGEALAGTAFLPPLLADRRVVAVGRLAAAALGAPYVRHPSHGGAAEFEAGLAALVPGAKGKRDWPRCYNPLPADWPVRRSHA